MKNSLLVVFMTGIAMASLWGENLFNDPGFEKSNTGLLLDSMKTGPWMFLKSTPTLAKIIENEQEAHSGKKYLRVEHSPGDPELKTQDYTGIVNPPYIPVNTNSKYRFKVWVRGNGTLILGAARYDVNMKFIHKEGKNAKILKIETPQWQEYSSDIITEDSDKFILPTLTVIGKSTLEFDDVSIEAIDSKKENIQNSTIQNSTIEKISHPDSKQAKTIKATAPPVKAVSSVSENPSNFSFDFEKWTPAAETSKGWKSDCCLFPEGWTTDGRPSEIVEISRIINPQDEISSRGQYSVFLNGRIVAEKFPVEDKQKKMRISLFAKGDNNSKLKIWVREFSNFYGAQVCNHVMEATAIVPGEKWQRYTTEIELIKDTSYVKVSEAQLALESNGVIIDNLNVQMMESKNQMSMPTLTIPQVKNNISIGNVFSQTDWNVASGSSIGFLNMNGLLDEHQSEYYLLADVKNLYICIRTPYEKLTRNIIKRDGFLWLDDSIEVHINNAETDTAFQFLVNANDAIFDQRMIKGTKDISWNCPDVKVKSFFENKIWTMQMALPLSELKIETGKEFGLNLCRNMKYPKESNTNLSGAPYFDYKQMATCTITSDAAGVFIGSSGNFFKNTLNLSIKTNNTGSEEKKYEIACNIDTENISKKQDNSITVKANSSIPVVLSDEQNPGKFGSVKILVKDDKTGKTTFSQQTQFDTTTSVFADTGLTRKIIFYPEQRKISLTLDNFKNNFGDLSEIQFICNGNVSGNTKVTKEHFKIYDDTAYISIPFNPAPDSSTNVQALLFDKKGDCFNSFSARIEDKSGLRPKENPEDYRTVVAPFTPIERSGNSLACWGRKYILNGSGLPEKILSQNEQVLADPLILVAVRANGEIEKGKSGKLQFSEIAADRVVFSGESKFKDFNVKMTGQLEYDGVILYTMEIIPEREIELNKLSLEIPFKDLKYFTAPDDMRGVWCMQFPADGEYRAKNIPVWNPDFKPDQEKLKNSHTHTTLYFPKEDGPIWNSKNFKMRDFYGNFMSHLTFGNNQYGLSWFTDTEKNWINDEKSPCVEILRKEDISTVKINFIAIPANLKTPRKLTFNLAATPVRPHRTGFNASWDYNLFGFGESSFIDVYVGGMQIKDPFMLDKFIKNWNEKTKRPTFFYSAKADMPLGDPITKYLYPEWNTLPIRFPYYAYEQLKNKRYGTDPANYVALPGCMCPSRIDFLSFRIKEMFERNPIIGGIYWDENYSQACKNLNHSDCGFIRDDGNLQPRQHLQGIREIDKRAQIILAKHNIAQPNMLVHVSGSRMPAVNSFADIWLAGEQRTGDLDFIEFWTLPRLEIDAAGAWGSNLFWLPQWIETAKRADIKTNRTMLALLKLFDIKVWDSLCMESLINSFTRIEKAFGTSAPDSQFLGYWQKENNSAVSNLPIDVKCSFFIRSDKGVLMYISNIEKPALEITAKLNFSRWGLKNIQVFDAENNKEIPFSNNELKFNLQGRDFKVFQIKPRI